MSEVRRIFRWAFVLCVALWFLDSGILFSPANASTTPVPENADGPLRIWNEKAKYYLVIAVDQTGVSGTELPFALTDGHLVAKQFEALGYRPLVEEPLIGATALKGKVNAALKRIRDLPELASVIVYYSGHGVTSPNDKDVALQLAGQDDLDYGLGIKVADLIESAKSDTYLGELHVIIDACFSGNGAFTGSLTLKEFGAKTTILTSSSTTQNSFSITLDGGTKLSAFTHTFLQALDEDWQKADDNGDGILRFDEVKTYSFNQLRKWYRQGRIIEQMEPQLVGGRHEEVFLAYKREKVERWDSSAREALNLVAVERSLIPVMPTYVSNELEKPEIPQEAQRLAQLLKLSDDPYVRGIKAQTEGRLEEANILFAQAEELEKEHNKEKLAKIYLARGRNETYAGNYKDALPWYEKRVALQPTKDPTLLNEFGQAWYRAGKYEEATPFFVESLSIREKSLTPQDPDLAISLNNLAELYRVQGKYAEAEPLFQRALTINEQVLGPEHPQVAIRLNNLAELYRAQGKYAKAEPLFQRVIKIFEAVLGKDNPNVATAINNLANLYRAQGKYAEAELLFQRALAINEQALGPEHPQVALNLNNLAALYTTQGKYSEAEPLYQRALRISETALGPEHPSVAIRLNNLAELYRTQGKYTEAEPLFQRALTINEQVLGPEHPQVALNLNNLAELYQAQGKYAEAESLFQRAIKIDEVALGPNHPGLATDLNNLANLYWAQGKYAEAEPLFQRAYKIFKVSLGIEHPNTKTVLENYADFLLKASLKDKITPLLPDLNIAFPGIFTKKAEISGK